MIRVLIMVLLAMSVAVSSVWAQEQTGTSANPNVYAEDTEEEFEDDSEEVYEPAAPSKFYWGSEIGLSFGTYSTIGITPYVGYRLLRPLELSVGAIYYYSWASHYSQHAYGGKVHTRFFINPQIYAQGQYSYISYNSYAGSELIYSVPVPYVLVGGGFRQPLQGNTAMEITVLFDVLQDENSQYDAGEPIIHLGVVVGI